MYSLFSSKLFGFVEEDEHLVASAGNDTFTKLPNELLLLIVAHLEDRKDLLSLIHTCQTLQTVAESALYHTIDIESSTVSASEPQLRSKLILSPAKTSALFHILILPRYSPLVTSFTYVSPVCNRDIKSEFKEWWTRLSDKCDEVDGQLSLALESLPNLQYLRITCLACWSPTPEKRHQFLKKLKTRQLKKLWFMCSCPSEDAEQTYEILKSPCLQSITTLQWDRHCERPREGASKTFDLDGILPKLVRLDYTSNILLDQFLSCRPITHLYSRTWDDDLHAAYVKGPAKESLTWLYCGEENDRRDEEFVTDISQLPNMTISGRSLVNGLRKEPTAFKNVQHLGNLCFMNSEPSEIVNQMKQFSSLKNLKSIEVLNFMQDRRRSAFVNWYNEDPWDESLLIELKGLFPRLEIVYIHGTSKYYGVLKTTWVVWLWDKVWVDRIVRNYNAVEGTWDGLDEVVNVWKGRDQYGFTG